MARIQGGLGSEVLLMRRLTLLGFLLSGSIATGSMLHAQTILQQADVTARVAAGKALDAQLAADTTSAAPAEVRFSLLQKGVTLAGASLAAGTRARARFDEAITAAQQPTDKPEAARQSLRLAIGDLVDDLLFKPVQEAELPKGFPGFAAVDEIELRSYPAYRMVRTSMQGGQMGAFWPLFRHIEEHGIAMTTPVQTDWQEAAEGKRERAATMAFLYGDKDLGQAGKDGKVEVVDVPELTVLTIGARGADNTSKVMALKQVLQDFVTKHPEWAVAGPIRTMGYNSPSVFGDRRYYEVQLPVKRVGKKSLSV